MKKMLVIKTLYFQVKKWNFKILIVFFKIVTKKNTFHQKLGQTKFVLSKPESVKIY